MWHSLRTRLLLATILVVLIAIGVTVFVATRRTEGEFQRYVERRSPLDDRRMGYILARFFEETGSWEGVQNEIENLSQYSGQQVVLVDAEGQVIADSAGKLIGRAVDARWPRPAVIVGQGGVSIGTAYLDPLKEPRDPAATFIVAVNRSVLIGALAAGLAAVIVTLFISGRILRPVEHLTSAAEQMARGT